jgi:hypothetical protein
MAARKVQVVVATATSETEHDGKTVRVVAGARYAATHPLVNARPELFEPAEEHGVTQPTAK